jgi:hypothetical protein
VASIASCAPGKAIALAHLLATGFAGESWLQSDKGDVSDGYGNRRLHTIPCKQTTDPEDSPNQQHGIR